MSRAVPAAWRRLPAALAVVVAASAVSGAALADLASAWRTQDVTVDGLQNEWPARRGLEDGPDVAVVNDDEFVYLMVSSGEPEVRDLLATGLIAWFDPRGGKARTFGVWIPGLIDRPLTGADMEASAELTATGIFGQVLDRFDVLGPGKNQRRLVDVTPALGIEVASGVREGELIYELRVPLAKTAERTYAVDPRPGRPIGLGLATPEPPSDRSRRAPLVGSSGYIGGYIPWLPGMGGRGFAPYRERPDLEPMSVWTTLELATAPAR